MRMQTHGMREVTQESQALAGFFSSLLDSIKTTIIGPVKATVALVTHGTNAALQTYYDDRDALRSDISDVASVVAPIVSLFGPVGKIVAVAIGVVSADWKKSQAKAAALAATIAMNDAISTWREYLKIAGSVPGRAIGVDNMTKVLQAGFDAGGLQSPVTIYRGEGSDLVNNATNGIEMWVKSAQSQGVKDALTLAGAWVKQFPSPTWNTAAGGQVLIDLMDAVTAYLDPTAPFSYAISPDVVATTNAGGIVTSSAAPALLTPTNSANATQPVVTVSAPPALVGPSVAASPLIANPQYQYPVIASPQSVNPSTSLTSVLSPGASAMQAVPTPTSDATMMPSTSFLQKITPFEMGVGAVGLGLVLLLVLDKGKK